MYALPILAVIVIIALVAVGVGLFLAALIAVCIAMLVSAGIVSSSILVGFRAGSISTGVQMAMFQIGAALGAVAGLGIAAAIKFFGQIHLGWMPIEGLGFSAGVCTGMVVAGSFGFLLQYALQKWGPRKGFEVVQRPESTAKPPSTV
jgi:hypothetical protein